MKKTKIVCTMGPNTNDREMMRKLIQNGMNVARFNFSHGDHEEQKFRMDMLKELREEEHTNTAILLDTKGPEIRTGVLKDGKKVLLKEGETITLTNEEIEGDETKVSLTYKGLVDDVQIGNMILIDDGLIGLKVKEKTETDIICTIVNGGELGERKGVNVPNVPVRLPAITEKDKEDLKFGVEQKIDFIAASFVRNAECILEIRSYLNKCGAPYIPIIAKIENSEGIDNIDEIIRCADGIMVARGDLGVEIPASQVPHIQKEIIRKCNEHYTPVITATQMLDSMIRNPRPTRAEVADVANAIYDGTDAIMLSGETAAGKYPVDALKMMADIAEMTEPHLDYKVFIEHRSMDGREKISSAVALATVRTAKNLKANAIVTPTMSGNTARLISNFRPKVPIYAITPNSTIQHKLQLIWGVTPLKGYQRDTTDHIMSQAMNVVRSRHLIHKGDLVVFTAGDPATNMTNGRGAVTNMMHVIEAE